MEKIVEMRRFDKKIQTFLYTTFTGTSLLLKYAHPIPWTTKKPGNSTLSGEENFQNTTL